MKTRSFEDIMSSWEETTHKPCTVKLPILKGTKVKGYVVRGFTYIDKEDFDKLKKWMWIKARRYVLASISKDNMDRTGLSKSYFTTKQVYLHKMILDTTEIVDHTNCLSLDNRRSNLRGASVTDNSINSKKIKNSSTPKGVDKLKDCTENPYRVRVYRGGSFVHISYHPDIMYAAEKYDEVLRTLYPSPFNRYNIPQDGERSTGWKNDI